MEEDTSYRRILKNSSLIGGASILNVAIGLVRTKVLAILLGPIGVGIASLYSGFLNAAGTLATMGLATAGTRQIAESFSKGDEHTIAVARRAMLWGALLLASTAAVVVWSLRSVLAVLVLGNASYASAIGWLALGIGLLVAAAAQNALLQGTYRVADVARVTVFASLLNTLVGVTLLWIWGQRGLVLFVLLGPITTFAVGYLYVSRMPKPQTRHVAWVELKQEWLALFRLGFAYVGGGVSLTLTQLWIRSYVGKSLGTAPLGQYQAAWTISMYYISFILTAMATDYYPRLTAVIHDRENAALLVNRQTEIALLLSTPILVGMMTLAPWVMHLLYSALFAPAVILLRWQILGDVLKVASWPLGFILLAAGDGKTFFWTECTTNVLTALIIVGFLPVIGLRITGIAYLATYIFYLPLVYWLARRRIAFRWSSAVTRLVTMAAIACVLVWVLTAISHWGIVFGCVLAVWLGIRALGRFTRMTGLGGSIGRLGEISRVITLERNS